MNEGQGQVGEIKAEDEWVNWASNGDCEEMKAGRQGKFIYITQLMRKNSLSPYIMHYIIEYNTKTQI